jgi:nitrogen-specific signal transduction histidine kinase
MTNEIRVLMALLRRNRVTRKTAIEKGLCENLTATISRLRQWGVEILTVNAKSDTGERYTRYKLVNPEQARIKLSYLKLDHEINNPASMTRQAA